MSWLLPLHKHRADEPEQPVCKSVLETYMYGCMQWDVLPCICHLATEIVESTITRLGPDSGFETKNLADLVSLGRDPSSGVFIPAFSKSIVQHR